MVHTVDADASERHAVVSCHVERPLDDRAWLPFEQLLRRRAGGFVVTPFLRPPHAASGENESLWLERAHTRRPRSARPPHALGRPDPGPTGGAVDAAAVVRAEVAWLRANGVEPRYFCGGGWYFDAPLAERSQRSATWTARPRRSVSVPRRRTRRACSCRAAPPAPRLRRKLLELPATHSLGMLARGLARLPGSSTFTSTTGSSRTAAAALAIDLLLRVLGRLRTPLAVAELADQAATRRRRVRRRYHPPMTTEARARPIEDVAQPVRICSPRLR